MGRSVPGNELVVAEFPQSATGAIVRKATTSGSSQTNLPGSSPEMILLKTVDMLPAYVPGAAGCR